MNSEQLEVMLETELREIPTTKEKRNYLIEVADYILNICPKHYKKRCDDCDEGCKTR